MKSALAQSPPRAAIDREILENTHYHLPEIREGLSISARPAVHLRQVHEQRLLAHLDVERIHHRVLINREAVATFAV